MNENNKENINSKKICKKCKSELNEHQEFCPNCGKQYIPFEPFLCSNCQYKIEEETLFCPSCGKKAKSEEMLKAEKKMRLSIIGVCLFVCFIVIAIFTTSRIVEKKRIQEREEREKTAYTAAVEELVDEFLEDHSELPAFKLSYYIHEAVGTQKSYGDYYVTYKFEGKNIEEYFSNQIKQPYRGCFELANTKEVQHIVVYINGEKWVEGYDFNEEVEESGHLKRTRCLADECLLEPDFLSDYCQFHKNKH